MAVSLAQGTGWEPLFQWPDCGTGNQFPSPAAHGLCDLHRLPYFSVPQRSSQQPGELSTCLPMSELPWLSVLSSCSDFCQRNQKFLSHSLITERLLCLRCQSCMIPDRFRVRNQQIQTLTVLGLFSRELGCWAELLDLAVLCQPCCECSFSQECLWHCWASLGISASTALGRSQGF